MVANFYFSKLVFWALPRQKNQWTNISDCLHFPLLGEVRGGYPVTQKDFFSKPYLGQTNCTSDSILYGIHSLTRFISGLTQNNYLQCKNLNLLPNIHYIQRYCISPEKVLYLPKNTIFIKFPVCSWTKVVYFNWLNCHHCIAILSTEYLFVKHDQTV